MYDVIVIGSGVAGSVVARKLAEEGKKHVLVLERRTHVAGNCFDKFDEDDVLVHVYGPHIFHTNDEGVYEYFSRFAKWHMFRHEVVAKVGDQLIPVPFNLNTLHMIYGKEKADALEQKLIKEYGQGSRVPIMKLMENQDQDIQEIAKYVHDNIFLKYTMKQWGQTPEEISPEVTGRVPVVISYDNGYFKDEYQGVPVGGFTLMFQKMLNHPNIEIRVGVDALEEMSFEEDGTICFEKKEFKGDVIYTGALDELFELKYGRLPYRSLDFKFEHFDKEDYQGHAVVNYTVSEDFTRITEFKYLTGQEDVKGTTIVKEYPFAYEGKEGQIPYYAILNEDNLAQYAKYVEESKKFKKFRLLGRLAEYKYYNIDAMARKALDMADEIMGEE
ncbi:MAG: UDP-galactopyranose mutase [Lachnospiraceae bacterium]|nr:UDP-galactopyranose mutase [Lachnospiraceae bacterium]